MIQAIVNKCTLTPGVLCCVVLCCRDAVNEMALHFLAKMKILVVRDIEREDIEFVCKVRNCSTPKLFYLLV